MGMHSIYEVSASSVWYWSDTDLLDSHHKLHLHWSTGKDADLLESLHLWVTAEMIVRGMDHPKWDTLDKYAAKASDIDPNYLVLKRQPDRAVPAFLRKVLDDPKGHGWDATIRKFAWADEVFLPFDHLKDKLSACDGIPGRWRRCWRDEMTAKSMAGMAMPEGLPQWAAPEADVADVELIVRQVERAAVAHSLLAVAKAHGLSSNVVRSMAAWGVRGDADIETAVRKAMRGTAPRITARKPVQKSLRFDVRKFVEDERIVEGAVLIPNVVDGQKDVIGPEAIAQVAADFLAKFQDGTKLGVQHDTFPDGLRLQESSILKSDWTVDGRTLPEGTWVMKVKVLDDDIWKAVKAGEITGFSIAGTGQGRYLKTAA